MVQIDTRVVETSETSPCSPPLRSEQNIKVLKHVVAQESMTVKKTMSVDTINPSILSFKAMEYAARGPVILRTLEIERELLNVITVLKKL